MRQSGTYPGCKVRRCVSGFVYIRGGRHINVCRGACFTEFFSLAKGSWLFVQLLSDDDDDKQVGMKGANLAYLKACIECKIVFKYIDAVYERILIPEVRGNNFVPSYKPQGIAALTRVLERGPDLFVVTSQITSLALVLTLTLRDSGA